MFPVLYIQRIQQFSRGCSVEGAILRRQKITNYQTSARTWLEPQELKYIRVSIKDMNKQTMLD